MPQQDEVNSEVRTKTLFRNIAYTGWILFCAFLVLWVFDTIHGTRAIGGMVISAVLGLLFTILMITKKIPGESESSKSGSS